MPPNDRHHTGEHPDPALILAIRGEIEGAMYPMREEMRIGFKEMRERFATGDTEIALIKQAQKQQEQRCLAHQTTQQQAALQPKTEKTKKEPNPYLMAFVSGALGAAGTVAALWFLVGIGQQAAKGTP